MSKPEQKRGGRMIKFNVKNKGEIMSVLIKGFVLVIVSMFIHNVHSSVSELKKLGATEVLVNFKEGSICSYIEDRHVCRQLYTRKYEIAMEE